MKSAIRINKNEPWQYMTLKIDRQWKETYHPNVKQQKLFFEKLEKSDDGVVKQNGHTYEIIGSKFTCEGNKIYYLMRDNENLPCAFIDQRNKTITTTTYADQLEK